VAVRKRTEEQQKDYIFDIFSKCHKETASNRLQVYYPTLCEQIYLWYRDYLSFDVDKMGLEITKVINRFTKEKNISKIPQDKDSFFKYLNVSIKTEKAGFHREYNENETIKIPKEKKKKLREIEDFIRMKESNLGRKLTYNERIQSISAWFKITEKKVREYLELVNNKNISSLDVNNNGEKMNILDSEDLKPPYLSNSFEEPESAFFTNFNMAIIREAVTSVLAKKQERARDCYKALFTLHCLKKDIRELYPILDQEIIDAFHKDEKNPKQYEIYLKYHPETDKKSAEAMASTNLKEFLKDIETYLKGK
jgi:DNA-directed RNA polymerase specialized sigma subunit